MPYNYAQTMLSDQTSSCSHQVHGVLVFECTVQSLCLFLLWGMTPAVLFFFSPSLLYGNKMVEWLWTFHFFVFGLSTLTLYSGTTCVCVETFWKITGAFLTLADLYFAVSAVRLLIKLFTICCDSHFWDDFKCRARFCKGFAVLTFLIHACCS